MRKDKSIWIFDAKILLHDHPHLRRPLRRERHPYLEGVLAGLEAPAGCIGVVDGLVGTAVDVPDDLADGGIDDDGEGHGGEIEWRLGVSQQAHFVLGRGDVQADGTVDGQDWAARACGSSGEAHGRRLAGVEEADFVRRVRQGGGDLPGGVAGRQGDEGADLDL